MFCFCFFFFLGKSIFQVDSAHIDWAYLSCTCKHDIYIYIYILQFQLFVDIVIHTPKDIPQNAHLTALFANDGLAG